MAKVEQMDIKRELMRKKDLMHTLESNLIKANLAVDEWFEDYACMKILANTALDQNDGESVRQILERDRFINFIEIASDYIALSLQQINEAKN